MKKPLLITSLGLACFSVNASATVYYESTGSSVSAFSGFLGGSRSLGAGNTGATVQSSSPFVVNGVSQGSYISATSYPTTNFTTVANASSQGIWVGILVSPATTNFWMGGLSLSSKTVDQVSESGFVVHAGWMSNPTTITLLDWHGNSTSSGYTITVGEKVALMVHVYDSGNTGTFNTASLYLDSNLSDGIDLTSAVVAGFNITTAASQIRAIRLDADPGPTGYAETRYYDNVIASSSQQDVVTFLRTGQHAAVPEPSTYGLIGIGALGVAIAARRRKLKTA